jgi:hypothetical protein
MKAYSIAGINRLHEEEKLAIYSSFIPRVLLERFLIREDFKDEQDRSLLSIQCSSGATDVTLDLRHQHDAQDPLLYAHLTDTINGQIHVLLYVVNDPSSPRFDIDRLPDGTPTEFGIFMRNIPAEIAAMEARLAPGQVRSGLRILRYSIEAFENFVKSLGQDIYFIEPLSYHNSIVFERYGFAYLQGLHLMKSIHAGFGPGGEYYLRLDNSTPFRHVDMHDSIRGRSWAIHDGIMRSPFTEVTLYKRVGEHSGIDTFPNGDW